MNVQYVFATKFGIEGKLTDQIDLLNYQKKLVTITKNEKKCCFDERMLSLLHRQQDKKSKSVLNLAPKKGPIKSPQIAQTQILDSKRLFENEQSDGL